MGVSVDSFFVYLDMMFFEDLALFTSTDVIYDVTTNLDKLGPLGMCMVFCCLGYVIN